LNLFPSIDEFGGRQAEPVRIKITRKNHARVDTVLEAGNCVINGINSKIIQKNFDFS